MRRSGLVVRRRVFAGSKSERDAVMLRTADGDLVLRRADGPAFGDRALDALEGKSIDAEGELVGNTFVMRRWTVLSG